MLMMNSDGVEISIAGCVEEILDDPNPMRFFFFFFFFFFLFFYIIRSLFVDTRSFMQH